jgi:hypothetical protein
MKRAKESPPRKKGKDPIPQFSSREEEAAFWDTHDFSDYWDELKPVKVRFAKNLSEKITIPLDPDALRELREQAHAQGIDPIALAQLWILERLRGGRGDRAASAAT